MIQATTITLEQTRKALRMTHTADDEELQRLLDAATQECLRFLNRSQLPTLPHDMPRYPLPRAGDVLYPGWPGTYWDGSSSSSSESEDTPSSEDPVAPDVAEGIILLVKAGYEGDLLKRGIYRAAAEALWQPYRIGMGV
jgi:hypothetical protein